MQARKPKVNQGVAASKAWEYVRQQCALGKPPRWVDVKKAVGCSPTTIKRLLDTGYLRSEEGIEWRSIHNPPGRIVRLYPVKQYKRGVV